MEDSKVKQSMQQHKRKLPWMKIEVKGSGGILLLGGIFIATAFAAVRMRGRTKRLPDSAANSATSSPAVEDEDQVVANDAAVVVDEERSNSLTTEENMDYELSRESTCDVQALHEDMCVSEIDQTPLSSQRTNDISMVTMNDVFEVASETCDSDIEEALTNVCESHMIYQNEKIWHESYAIEIKKEKNASSDELQSDASEHYNEHPSEETDSTCTDDKQEENEDSCTELQIVMNTPQHEQNLDEKEREEMFLADSKLGTGKYQIEQIVVNEENEDKETILTENHLMDVETVSNISSQEMQFVEVQELENDVLATELNFAMHDPELILQMTEFEHVAEIKDDRQYAMEIVETEEKGNDAVELSHIEEIAGGDGAIEFAPGAEMKEEEKETPQSEPLHEDTESSLDGEVEMTDEGSDGTRASSVDSNADAIWPAELIEQDKCQELTADSTHALTKVVEVEDKIHSAASEQENGDMTNKKAASENMSLKESSIDLENRFSFMFSNSHKGISLLLAAITLLISIYLLQLLSTSVAS